jgi:uncharacterized damage-inducible protein DinB
MLTSAKEESAIIPEVRDQFDLLNKVHHTMDKMLEDLSPSEWTTKPQDNMNSIAAVIEHVVLVERKFLSVLAGSPEAIDTQAPFKANQWDVAAIREAWRNSLPAAERVLAAVKEEDLSSEGLTLGIGPVNKRQLIAYMIAHTAHHRGQIPILKKLLRTSS